MKLTLATQKVGETVKVTVDDKDENVIPNIVYLLRGHGFSDEWIKEQLTKIIE